MEIKNTHISTEFKHATFRKDSLKQADCAEMICAVRSGEHLDIKLQYFKPVHSVHCLD
jgi:hypothetical protein